MSMGVTLYNSPLCVIVATQTVQSKQTVQSNHLNRGIKYKTISYVCWRHGKSKSEILKDWLICSKEATVRSDVVQRQETKEIKRGGGGRLLNEDGIKASELLSRKKGLREELCELNSVNVVNTSKQIKSGAISQEHLYCYSIYLGFFFML